jgi:hypothetical protein
MTERPPPPDSGRESTATEPQGVASLKFTIPSASKSASHSSISFEVPSPSASA